MWTAIEIKNLRQRLGWSKAQMSQRLSCELEVIHNLEAGSLAADTRVQNQMNELLNWVEKNSSDMIHQAVADRDLHHKNLTQLHRDDLEP